MNTKIYLDIDGVLITRKSPSMTKGAIEFINFILENFDCYWLTTHCRDNDTSSVIGYLSKFFPHNVIENLKSVKPVVWDALKTELTSILTFIGLMIILWKLKKKCWRNMAVWET